MTATLIFLPGFMTSTSAYQQLLAPLATAGMDVHPEQLYARGLATLLGKSTVADEAAAAAAIVRNLVAAGEPIQQIWLAGHSRGGQAAWQAANLLATGPDTLTPGGLILLDPVDGEGRRPSGPSSTAREAVFRSPTLIIGAGVGGVCAPEQVNHAQFARATPAAAHVIVKDLGHADILNGRARTFGRRLCGGGTDPDVSRWCVSDLMVAAMAEALVPGHSGGLGVEWVRT